MFDFPEMDGFPLARWVDTAMSWLLTHLDGFFDVIGFIILNVVVGYYQNEDSKKIVVQKANIGKNE
jgi:ABC-type proline/glycine betaine transport system permease subunit